MHARTALLAAIACGALALAIVTADVAWSLEARIESRGVAGWETIASGPFEEYGRYAYPGPLACAGPDLRLVVHNDRPIGASGVRVQVSYWNTSAERNTVVLDERWDLDAFESRTFAFRVPDAAFPTNTTGPDGKPRPLDPYGAGRMTSVQAEIHEFFLSGSVCPEASA